LCAKPGVAGLVSDSVKRIRTEEPDEGNLHVRVWVAADKAAILRVQVPPCQLPDSDTKQYHSSCWVTTCPLRGVNGPAALKTQCFSGGCNLGV